jgi:hypothetical protein
MPRYHFNLSDGRSIPDLEGSELPDLASARREAARYAGQLLQDDPQAVWDGGEWVLEVTDARGLLLFRLILSAIEAPAIAKY